MSNSLWKPQSENTGKVAFLGDDNWGNGQIWLVDADTGALLATGNYDKAYEDGRSIYRFDKAGSSINTKSAILVGPQGQYIWIGDPKQRHEGLTGTQGALPRNSQGAGGKTYSQFDYTAANRTSTAAKSFFPSDSAANYAGIPGVGNVAKPEVLDPNLNTLTQISDTQIEFTDPIETLRKVAQENRGQVDENILKSMEYAGKLSEANTQQLIDYLDTMTPYQRQLIGIENAFNQQERLKAAETATPGVTDMLRGELKNAQTLASGRLLKDSEDRALEQVARSAGADAAWTRGLGDDSLIGQTLSDKLSVSQRQQVMQQGQNYLSQALQNAVGVLMDTPQKATMGSQIPAQPSQTIADIALNEQQILNQYTTMSPESALQAYINQRQNQAQMDYNTKIANAQFQEAYTQRGIDIAASNIQAMNNYNQAVLSDQANSASSSSISDQINKLQFLRDNDYINDERYQRYLEQIANGGFIDFESLGHQLKGEDWSFSEHYNEQNGINISNHTGGSTTTYTTNTTPSNTTQNGTGDQSDTGQTNTTNETNNTTPKYSLYRELTDENGNPQDTSAVLHPTTTYKEGYKTNLIIQEDGTITIPEYNPKFLNSGYYTVIDSLGHLTPFNFKEYK